MQYKIFKYTAIIALPIIFIGCGNGNVGNNNGPVSLGKLPTGQSVMISSGNISVNAQESISSVGTLYVPGLASNQTVTFIMSNSQNTPSLLFGPQANASENQSINITNISRCTVTAESSGCTIVSSTNGAKNGGYVANLAYEMTNPTATGQLNPIPYVISGGIPTPPGPTPPGPTPAPPAPVFGTINMSLSAESLNVGGQVTATYTLSGASNLTSDIIVTAVSSDKSVLSAYNDVNQCTLSMAKTSCTITESGLSVGTAIISSNAGANYTIADSNEITVNTPGPTPVYGNITMISASGVDVGGYIDLYYTLEGSQNVTTPVKIIATSSDPKVLDSSSPSCEVTTANPTCTIQEQAKTPGTVTISSNAGANYTIADSNEITVNVPF